MPNNTLKGKIKRLFFPLVRKISPLVKDPDYSRQRKLLAFFLLLLLEFWLSFLLSQKIYIQAQKLWLTSQRRRLLQRTVGQIEKDFELVKKSTPAVESLLESLPTTKDNHLLLERLNSLGASRNLSLTGVTFLPTNDSAREGLAEQGVKVSLLGQFENVIAFVEDVEGSQRPTLVESLELLVPEKSAAVGVVKANFLFKTFFIKPNQPEPTSRRTSAF